MTFRNWYRKCVYDTANGRNWIKSTPRPRFIPIEFVALLNLLQAHLAVVGHRIITDSRISIPVTIPM